MLRFAAVVVVAAVVDAYPRKDDSAAPLQQLSHSQAAALSASDQASCTLWKGKGGDDTRAGHSVSYSGPSWLAEPAWTYATGSKNYQSPVVDCSGSVYTGTADGTVTKLSIDGKVLWSVPIFAGHLATPALDYDAAGKLVVYITPLTGIRAFGLDASNGNVLLNVTYGSESGQLDGWSVGAAAGVLVASGRAAAAPVGGVTEHGTPSVFVLDASTGAKLWSFWDFDGAASLEGSVGPYNFMPVVAVDDTPGPSLMYETSNGAVVKHDLMTGVVLWRITSPSNESSTTAGCAMTSAGAQGCTLVCVSTLGLLQKGLIRAIDVADGSILWQTHTALGGEAGPAIADGRVYLGLLGFQQAAITPGHKGTMTALNVSTGAILWQTQTHANPSIGSASCVPDTFDNAAVGADGTVYFGWWGGHVYALDGATGSKLSSFATGSGIQGGPAIGDGVVYFQTCEHLYAFRTSS